MWNLRPWLSAAVAIGAASVASPRAVSAQTPTVNRLDLYDGASRLSELDRETYFNRARCSCDSELTLQVSISGRTQHEGTLEVVYGQRCFESDGTLNSDCVSLFSYGLPNSADPADSTVRVSELTDGCDEKEERRQLFVVFDADDDGEWALLETLDYRVDTRPPPPPVALSVRPGEGLAEVVFGEPESDADEAARYQVLCTTSSVGASLPEPSEPAFDSPWNLCGRREGVLQDARTCSEASAGANSITVGGLQNGVPYVFEIVSIDDSRNPSNPVLVGETRPEPEEDLWERYKNAGGTADGEHCFIATASYGRYDHPQVLVLRRFRDEILKPTRLGRSLVHLYYRVSPPVAAAIARHDTTRRLTRAALWPIASVAGLTLTAPITTTTTLIAIVLALVTRWRRVRRNRI